MSLERECMRQTPTGGGGNAVARHDPKVATDALDRQVGRQRGVGERPGSACAIEVEGRPRPPTVGGAAWPWVSGLGSRARLSWELPGRWGPVSNVGSPSTLYPESRRFLVDLTPSL